MVAEISLGAQRSARFPFTRNVKKAFARLHKKLNPGPEVGSRAA